MDMKLNEALRLLAGIMVLLSAGLAAFADQRWLWLTVFVGANLVQSAFTGWCPAIWAFRRLGIKE